MGVAPSPLVATLPSLGIIDITFLNFSLGLLHVTPWVAFCHHKLQLCQFWQFMVRYLTSCYHVIRESCNFLIALASQFVSTLPSLVAIRPLEEEVFRF